MVQNLKSRTTPVQQRDSSRVAAGLASAPPLHDEINSETEGDTEGSMTARTQGSVSSSNTEPPSIASEDESGMLDRLRGMGIGDAAVGHVMWVADSAGGASVKGQEASKRWSTNDPPFIDGLVPLRAGRVHWAG